MGNQSVSPETQRLATHLNLELEHLGITLGTIVGGFDLKKPLDDPLISFKADFFREESHLFRNQEVDQDQLVRFAKYFGELDAFPFGKGNEKNPCTEIVHGENLLGPKMAGTRMLRDGKPVSRLSCTMHELPPMGRHTFSDSHACYLGMQTSKK